MPVAELAHALPALLVVGVLPGWALATLLAPGWRWWERLAAAPGLSAGGAGVIGLAFHHLHLPFTAASALPLEGLVVGAAAWRPRSGPSERRRHDGAAPVIAGALCAGAISAALLVAGYRDLPVPVATDGPVHATVAGAIAARHDTLPVLPDPSSGPSMRVRTGVEAVAALASEVGGPAAPAELLPFTVLAVLLLPLGLASLALEATESAVVATLAPFLGVGWAFPSVAVSFGEFPYVVDATLVAPLLLAAVRTLRPGQSRRHLPLVATLTAAVWAVHALEAITVAVIAIPLCAARAWPQRRRAAPLLAAVAGAALAGAGLVTMLSRVPAPAPPSPIGSAGTVVTEVSRFGGDIGIASVSDTLNAFVHYAFPSALVLAAYLLGLVAALVERRLRWAVVAHALLLACFVDVLSTGLLRRLWVAAFPWSVEDRLPAVQYWVVPLLAAFGTVWLGGRLAPAGRRLGRRLAFRWSRAGLARSRDRAGAALLGATALVAGALGAAHDATVYAQSVRTWGVVTAADLSVIAHLDRRLPSGTVVLTDGTDDAGQWLAVLGRDIPYYSSQYIKNHPHDPGLAAVQRACADPAAARAALRGVDAVFVGSRRIAAPLHPWSVRCIAAIPGLEPVATAGSGDATAAAYLVR